jgi:hypothetical protein
MVIDRGEFKEGRKEGRGKLMRRDGSEFEGLFQDDHIFGSGTMRDTKGNIYTSKVGTLKMF